MRIDKKKKMLVTTLLQALGMPRDQIIGHFYRFDTVFVEKGEFYQKLDDSLIGTRIVSGMISDYKDEKELVGKRITKDILNTLMKNKLDRIYLGKTTLLNRVFGADVVDPDTGEIIIEQGRIVPKSTMICLLSFPSFSLA